ncbi:MAG: DUF4974 domain-containing protein [Prolixibacteraceae bacterium]|nr:DUF4974 domain-containing protein [Prolixibacteraceae bacterium]
MNPVSENIYSIIAKSLTDKLTEREEADLEAWRLENRENNQEYNDLVYLWSKTGSLILPDAIDKEKARNIISKGVRPLVSSKKWISVAIRIAAVFVLAIILSGIYNYFKNSNDETVNNQDSSSAVYQEIKASYGTQAKVELADGTTVYLNSGSKLKFPLSFKNKKERRVTLDGEGFFNVTENKRQAFIVQTGKLDIRVLGTSFNVDAYSDNRLLNVALVEGSVALQKPGSKKDENIMELTPNQVATLNIADNKIYKTNVSDMYKYTAWVKGRIVFFGDPIQTIVKKLEKWYNVDIVISDKKLENYRFTGTFIDEPLEQVLSILSLTSPMSYVVQHSNMQTDNSMSKRKVILKSK